jgi:SpoVK/Ycf46/Vps4 family AAA+-type ATPase
MQAVRRRFDKRIYIPLPDQKARQHMFKVCYPVMTVNFLNGFYFPEKLIVTL